MGIIREDAGARRAGSPLSGAELVRPRSAGSVRNTVASGHESVSLNQRFVVYRNTRAARRITKIVPLWSIESFCIRTARSYALLALACAFLVVSVAAGFWLYGIPAIRASQLQLGEAPSLRALQIPGALLVSGILLTVIFALYHRTKLIIYTLSGVNPIHLPLSSRLADAAEAFVGEIEAQIERLPGSGGKELGRLSQVH